MNPSINVISTAKKVILGLLIGTGGIPDQGIDCSALVYLFYSVGINMPRTSSITQSEQGKSKSKRMKSSRVIYFFSRPEESGNKSLTQGL